MPEGALIHINGKLYGTTMEGGADGNNGTVFSITTSGTEKVLHSFAGGSSFDSSEPFDSLIDVNGTLLWHDTVRWGLRRRNRFYHYHRRQGKGAVIVSSPTAPTG